MSPLIPSCLLVFTKWYANCDYGGLLLWCISSFALMDSVIQMPLLGWHPVTLQYPCTVSLPSILTGAIMIDRSSLASWTSYKDWLATPDDHCDAVHQQAADLCILDFPPLVETDPVLLGPSKGHTCGTLSVSTSVTIDHQFLTRFTSSLILFLSPVFLLSVVVSHGLTLPLFEHDPQSVRLGLNLVCLLGSHVPCAGYIFF